jgi:hypothetical protein
VVDVNGSLQCSLFLYFSYCYVIASNVNNKQYCASIRVRDSVAGVASTLRAGRFEARTPVGTIFCSPYPSRSPSGPPSLQYSGYRVSFPVARRSGRGVDYPPLLAPALRMNTAIPLLGLCAVMACYAENCTLLCLQYYLAFRLVKL